MGGLGRRHRARARRLLPRPPRDRAGLVRAGLPVLLGAAVALALIAAGEWTRRHEILTGVTGLPKAHIPSVLTAAGTAIAYADVYAAYALYGFIGPAVAFLLLGAVALFTLAAALLHGPALAGLGAGRRLCHAADRLDRGAELLGALSLPRHGHSRRLRSRPGEAVALARRHRRRGERALGPAGHWRSCGADPARFPYRRRLHAGRAPDRLGSLVRARRRAWRDRLRVFGALAAYLFASMLLVLATGHDKLALTLFVVLVAATVAIAWRTDAAIAAVPAAAILVALIFAQWSLDFDLSELGLPTGPVPDSLWKPEHYLVRRAAHARRRLRAALRRFRLSGPRPRGAAPRRRSCGAPPRSSRPSPFSSRSIIASPASTARSPLPARQSLLAGAFALATEALEQAEPAPGQRRGRRHLRHRRDRFARARAQPRFGEGLAHRRARA